MRMPMQVKAVVSTACSIAFLSGCADSGSHRATVADSAGIGIVTNDAGFDQVQGLPEWSLSSEPVRDIGGGADPETPLYRITSVHPLEGGRVGVGTSTPAQAIIFDANDRAVVQLGRPGEGPGEFSSVASVLPIASDSVAVWDENRRRISIFDRDGRLAREVDLSQRVPLSPAAAPNTQALAGLTTLLAQEPDGIIAFVVAVWGPEVGEVGVQRLAMPSHRIDLEGQTVATYGPFPGVELFAHPAAGVLPYPFGAETDAVVSTGQLVVGTAVLPELRFYGSDAALEQIVRWSDHDRTVAGSSRAAAFRSWVDEQLAPRDPSEQAFLREMLGSIPEPESFPAYSTIVGDPVSGQIWVGEYPGQLGLLGLSPEVPRVPARRWLVFQSDGSIIAVVRTPEGFEPAMLDEGLVWGVYRDQLDVESVRAYAVVGP